MVNVYSPFTGQVYSLDCYCYISSTCPSYPPYAGCSGSHTSGHCAIAGYTLPIDISASYGASISVWFDGPQANNNNGVRYVSFHAVSFGCTCGFGSPWADSIVVSLYSKSQTLFGKVVVHHVANRQYGDTGLIDLGTVGYLTGIYVGNVVSSDAVASGCICYKGSHVHMQSSGGMRGPGACNQSLTASSTVLYTF